MLNFIPTAFATVMAAIDVIVLGWMKKYVMGTATSFDIFLGMLLYGLQPAIFLQSLKYESMTVMNIMWDLISDILVTVSGLFYFKEKLSPIKKAALGLAFTSIVLFSYDEWHS